MAATTNVKSEVRTLLDRRGRQLICGVTAGGQQ
jgi:hypothetical protein